MFNGNAFFFLKNTWKLPGACVVGVADSKSNLLMLRSGLPWVPKGGRMARILAHKARVALGTIRPIWDIGPEAASACQLEMYHGMPIKGIMKMNPLNPVVFHEVEYTIATSPFTAGFIQQSWGLPLERILCTGEPKTDGFLDSQCPDALSQIGEHYNKIVLYAPTHREETGPVDGRENATTANIILSVLGSQCVREALRRQRACMIIAPHPWVRNMIQMPIEPPFFFSVDLDVHTEHLMMAADYLVSDYSSVIVDWLLLSRPMGLFCPDLEEYRAYRGFPYFDFNKMFSWMIYQDLDALAADIDQKLTKWAGDSSLEGLKALFHQHEAGGASVRLYDWLMKKYGGPNRRV